MEQVPKDHVEWDDKVTEQSRLGHCSSDHIPGLGVTGLTVCQPGFQLCFGPLFLAISPFCLLPFRMIMFTMSLYTKECNFICDFTVSLNVTKYLTNAS